MRFRRLSGRDRGVRREGHAADEVPAVAAEPQPKPEQEAAPLALQLAARIEKVDPPSTRAVCAAAALATVELLDHPSSGPDGEWHDAVAAWNGARIRKIVRRARASAWHRVQEVPGVTVARDGAEVRAFVPGPTDRVPTPVAKLQIQSSDLDEITRATERPTESGLIIAITPQVEMSWGKQAAQCAHAAHRAWMRADDDVVSRWDDAGRPITVVHPGPALWDELREDAAVAIRDGGFTEIPAGTNTTVALWA